MNFKKIILLVAFFSVFGTASCTRNDLWSIANKKVPCIDITYSPASQVYQTGIAIADDVPSVAGDVAAWSVNTPLPPGLTINTSTGVISGIPTLAQDAASYTVTASNSNCSESVDIQITVNQSYRYFLYFGNEYAGTEGKIFRYQIDMDSGLLSAETEFDNGNQSSYLAVSPSQRYLYSAMSDGNSIRTFSINSPDGSLGAGIPWNLGFSPDSAIVVHPNGNFLFGTSQGATRFFDVQILPDGTLNGNYLGTGPLYSTGNLINGPKVLAIKPSGDFVYVANYNARTINRYSIDLSTGSIVDITSSLEQFATDRYPQAIVFHPTKNYLYAANDADHTIQFFVIDAGGLSTGVTSYDTGSGVTSMIIDPAGNFLYCVSSWVPSTIYGYQIQDNGSLSALSGSPYEVPNDGSTQLQYITIDPTGKYLYGPINGAGYIEGYSIDASGILHHLSNWTYSGSDAKNPVIVTVPF